MLFEQRAEHPEVEFVPTKVPWMHDASDADRRQIAQSCDWWYVVVDELVGAWVKLVFAPWPTLDQMGRLVFSKLGSSIWLDIDGVTKFADDHRDPDRPLRISDVFAIYADKGPSKVERWQQFVDITPDARESAKIAAFATRGDLMTPEQLARFAPPDDAQPTARQLSAPEMPGSTAAAAV